MPVQIVAAIFLLLFSHQFENLRVKKRFIRLHLGQNSSNPDVRDKRSPDFHTDSALQVSTALTAWRRGREAILLMFIMKIFFKEMMTRPRPTRLLLGQPIPTDRRGGPTQCTSLLYVTEGI